MAALTGEASGRAGKTARVSSFLSGHLTGEARTPDEIRDATYLFTGDVGAKQSRFWLLLILSAIVATAGVVGDSTATVIGAMIIAPLAIPIQGVAVGVANGELRPLLLSTAIVRGVATVVVAIAALLGFCLPELEPASENSQITGRVTPTLVDLAAAAATGLAGAFAVARRDIGDILPGVAIAISLVPPLCVVGVTAVEGDWAGSVGALLLFATNVLAMIVVGIALFSGLGYLRARRDGTAVPRRTVYAVLGVATGVIVVALGVSTYRTVQLTLWQDAAERVASDWAREGGERLVAARFEGDTLVLTVEGRGDGARDEDLPPRLRPDLPAGTPVVLDRLAGDRNDLGELPR